MNVSSISNPAGQPSMVTPIAGPCDSPKVVILNRVPYELDIRLKDCKILKLKDSRMMFSKSFLFSEHKISGSR